MDLLENRETATTGSDRRGAALPAVADHHIHVFYVARGSFADEPALALGQLAAADGGRAPSWIPADLLPALTSRYAEERLWLPAPASPAPEGPAQDGDLFPHIERLVTGRPEADAKRWTLSGRVLRLLSDADLYEESVPREERTAKDLELSLTKRAQTRMAAAQVATVAEALHLKIRAMTLFQFRTGVTIADVEVQAERPDRQVLAAAELVEALACLSRFNALRWRLRPKPKGQKAGELLPGPAFSLSAVIGALVGDASAGRRQGARFFTYAYVHFAAPLPPEPARRFAVQLARHYTDDYALVAEPGRIAVVQDFENVQHVCALEGAATIVNGGAQIPAGTTPEFIAQFYDQTFTKNYLPIALLNLHEREEVIDITVNAAFWPDTSDINHKTLQRLESVRDRALRLSLCYRFGEVSHVTMHNAVHRAFREVFDLGPLLRDLNRDVLEVDGFLRGLAAERAAAAAEARERRWRWAGVAGTAALAGLTAFTIFKEFIHIVFHNDVWAGWGGIIAGAVCFGASVLIGWRSGHFVRHAEVKSVIHEAEH